MNAASAPHIGLVRCPACSYQLAGPWAEAAESVRNCPRCRQELRVAVFPPLYQAAPPPLESGVRAQEGEATCFFHPEKRAERPCDRCGRFLCALCDLPIGARHLCPSCLKAKDEYESLPELIVKRVSWGHLALLLSLVSSIPIFIFFWLFSGMITIFLVLYGWNKPGSLVYGKRRLFSVIALCIAVVQLVVIMAIYYQSWQNAITRGP